MFSKARIEAPQQIEEHLEQVDGLEFRAPFDFGGSVWMFPDTVHRELRYFRLNKSLHGPVQNLRAQSRHMVEDETFLGASTQHIVGVSVNAYEIGDPKYRTEFAVETPGLYVDEDQFKAVAARGLWEVLSGIRLATDERALEEFEASQREADDELRRYLNVPANTRPRL